MPDTPTLVMPSDLSLTLSVQHTNKTTKLGDGYEQYATLGTVPEVSTYTFTTPALSTSKYNTIKSQLEPFASSQSLFSWSPDNGVNIPFGNYYINTWTVTRLGPDSYSIAGSLKLDPESSCTSFSSLLFFSTIPAMLEASINFLKTYTRDTLPLIANAQGVTANTFHDISTRGGYLPNSAGTSEGQALLIKGLLSARNRNISNTAKNDALTLATLYSNALLTYFYNATIPTVPTAQTWLPHWLVNAKAAFTSKGSIATKSVNNGFFDVSVSFINGVGTLSTGTPQFGEKLSCVYKVYTTTSTLLWKNIYSPLISGTEYSINYWVQDLNLLGTRYKTYPKSVSDNGTAMVTTSETAGKIVLNDLTFTGTLKVSYMAYVGSTIAKNATFGAYPGWRSLSTSPLERTHSFKASSYLSEAFKLLKEATGNTQWDRAYASNNYSTNQASTVSNIPYIFKADTTQTEAFSLPGTRLLVTNNPSTSTASRTGSGWVQASIGNDLTLLPFAELQNLSIALQFQSNTTLNVNTVSNTTTCLEVIVSTSKTITDTSQQYTYYLPVTSNTNAFSSIKPDEFVKFTTSTLWHSAIVNPNTSTYGNNVTSYSSSGGTSTNQNQISAINTFNRYTTLLNLTKGLGSDGASFVFSNAGNKVPGIYYKKTGSGTVDYKITDSNSNVFLWDLQDTLGQWVYFKPSDWSTAYNLPPINGDGLLTGVDIVANSGTSTVEIWYIGDSPNILPYPCTTYKTSILSRVDVAHTFTVGDILAVNSPSSTLYKNPGVVPFGVTTLNGVIDSWRGSPLIGYQSVFNWYDSGQFDKVQQVLDYIDESQTAYSVQNTDGIDGHFSPNYLWPKWDEGILGTADIKYSFKSNDPNFEWGGYQDRITEDVAKYWMNVTTDNKARSIVMRRLKELDRSYRFRGFSGTPHTFYSEFVFPFTIYQDISSVSLIIRAALYANIAGGNPAVTFRLIKKSLDYLRGEYVSTGNMAGTFTANQISFTSGGQTYKECYSFHHAEAMFTISELLRLQTQINYPSCSTSLV